MRRGLKTKDDIARMREAGLLVWEAHEAAAKLVAPGVTTFEIDAAVEGAILARGGIPLFKGVPGPTPFPAATCLSVNSEVVHGIPGKRQLREGDIISIDIGVRLNGWCGDAAVTRPVGAISQTAQSLLDATEGALRLALRLMAVKHRWSEVARELARYVRTAGFSVVEGYGGHGIGREMWEHVHVPNLSDREFERHGDFRIEPGLVIAVEPMVNAGKKDVRILADHWTVVTADGKPSAHFEHTIAMTPEGPRALTVGPDGSGWAL